MIFVKLADKTTIKGIYIMCITQADWVNAPPGVALSVGVSFYHRDQLNHYNDVIMSAMASQFTSLTIVYSTVYSRRRSKKTPKPRVTGLCEGNSPVTGEFPAQRASSAENVSIWWRHHASIGEFTRNYSKGGNTLPSSHNWYSKGVNFFIKLDKTYVLFNFSTNLTEIITLRYTNHVTAAMPIVYFRSKCPHWNVLFILKLY